MTTIFPDTEVDGGDYLCPDCVREAMIRRQTETLIDAQLAARSDDDI